MKTFTIFHFFAGIGGKGLGAANALAKFGDHEATFETIGGIDIDEQACRDFEMLVGAPCHAMDVHKMEPADLRRIAGDRAPDAIMLSPPCKGLSALLSAKKAKEPAYQEMNQLMLRAIFLICSTWDTPPSLIFIENVPRMASRGKAVVQATDAILRAHGYAVTTGNHDCGELGNLAQHRRRWFAVARHQRQIPGFLYQPPKHRVRACGEVLGPLPMPGDVETGGPMHSVPRLSWRNWLRLALIPAGGDWRNLAGVLADGQAKRELFRRLPVTEWAAAAETVTGPGGSSSTNIADPRWGGGRLGVVDWKDPAATVTGESYPSNGSNAVADPRIGQLAFGANENRHRHKLEVLDWEQSARTVTGTTTVGGGAPSVADPRIAELDFGKTMRAGHYGVADWNAAPTVLASHKHDNAVGAVADPRFDRIAQIIAPRARRNDDLGVLGFDEAASTVTGDARPRKGRFSVADPRFSEGKKKNWQQVVGVTSWNGPAPTITSGADIHGGAFSVNDPRIIQQPRYRIMTLAEALDLDLPLDKAPPFIPVIIAEDGTWHRPLTTLELAVLQSFPWLFEGKPLVLAGKSHTRWREAIGNAVPPMAALAIAEQLLKTLLVASLGAWSMSNDEIWVAPDQEGLAA